MLAHYPLHETTPHELRRPLHPRQVLSAAKMQCTRRKEHAYTNLQAYQKQPPQVACPHRCPYSPPPRRRHLHHLYLIRATLARTPLHPWGRGHISCERLVPYYHCRESHLLLAMFAPRQQRLEAVMVGMLGLLLWSGETGTRTSELG